MIPKILIVDDESSVLEVLQDAFSKEPYEVICAGSAAEALDIMAMKQIDLVISDDQMPGLTGTEFLAQVRKKYPNTTRIILTGHANLETAITSINEAEIYRFFTKPCNMLDLIVTVRLALHNKDLKEEVRRLNEITTHQSLVIEEMEHLYPGISRVRRNEEGDVIIDEEVEDELWETIISEWAVPIQQTEHTSEI